MTGVTISKLSSHEKAAVRILEKTLRRARWAASDRDAIAGEIDKAVSAATSKLQRDLETAKAAAARLQRELDRRGQKPRRRLASQQENRV